MLVAFSSCAASQLAEPDSETSWSGIKEATFGQHHILDAGKDMHLDAPERAEDAAIVPVTVHIAAALASRVKTVTLIIDEDPAPIAAKFTYGEAAGVGDRVMATRVRVDRYTFVRAVAETRDGKFYMTKAFVKASGGCSAPASRDLQEAEKSLGKMRIKTTVAGKSNMAEVMIRHPNISGLAIDQLSRGYPPARFISELTVRAADKLIFSMEGGIAISEDPHFRFTYEPRKGEVLSVVAEDSIGTHFSGQSGNPS
ncbi:quinoprotein dehydrogenase-associated SoxYZ-like carrier [Hyphomicrobium sp.]|jgi:sulfur-oxidizing protein SoxY|uniref:quinoprotein dehydrogenase-associated SoxYZ-like carrier n=1 Tax=Hyphomicrobium sp. TaxID=82 RepID=UPI002C006231|nr:quinoprotein dehydrogenase-associated SoxYZ-like carrier [Hyphomicrobium sp.]HVZ05017.1 quinoprotein dehydrogenase-associated SoxYZ-like carrier [Hyphomicrobium sp.]